MRILIYKRTHQGDPDHNGCWGVHDCMGSVRGWDFDAVIGVGGVGAEPRACEIAGKINWVGIGPRKIHVPGYRGPTVTFDCFRDFGAEGEDFRQAAPRLAERIYARNVRVLMRLGEQERREAVKILELAQDPELSLKRNPKHGPNCRPCR